MAKKILVVDDDPVGQALMLGRLSKAGYEVLQALDGVKGMELAHHNKPDLIILDIEMPKMNGYTFINALRLEGAVKHIPVIVLTARLDNKPIFQRKGISDYFVKPVSMDELLGKIAALLGS